MKGLVIYKGKYGATAQYASWLAEALYLPVADIDKQQPVDLQQYDYIIVGSPVYIGKLLVRDWLRKNQALLQYKKIYLFIVCGSANDKRIQEIILEENLPLSFRESAEIFFLPGRVVMSQLSWYDKMLLKVRALMEPDPGKKQLLKRGFDGVKREHINKLIKQALHYSNAEILP